MNGASPPVSFAPGSTHRVFSKDCPRRTKQFSIELGFVEKLKLPKLLALADVLVQPGQTGSFNDFRLPSKIPEFLAMGKPVILPPTNVAEWMTDGKEALFLKTGSPQEIADLCQRIFADSALATSLGEQGVALARRHFWFGPRIPNRFGIRERRVRPPFEDGLVIAPRRCGQRNHLARRADANGWSNLRPTNPAPLKNELAHDVHLLALLVRGSRVHWKSCATRKTLKAAGVRRRALERRLRPHQATRGKCREKR